MQDDVRIVIQNGISAGVIVSFAVYGFCGWWISWLCASSRQSSSSDYQVSMQGFLCLRCNIPVEK